MLTIIVEGTNKLSHGRTHGCLHLIDLAGSERVGKSGAEGQQLLEAQHINKSLRWVGGWVGRGEAWSAGRREQGSKSRCRQLANAVSFTRLASQLPTQRPPPLPCATAPWAM